MRRIIPVACAIMMFLIAISQDTDNMNVQTNMNDIANIEVSIQEPTPEITIEVIQEQEPTPEPVWWTDYDLDLLAAVIFYEAGSDCCTDEHQQLVGQVVVNRMNDSRFPDTIYDVITDTKYGIQYSTAGDVVSNAGNRDIIPQRCYDNALVVLNGEVECPVDVIFQANFKQGTGTYKVFKTSYSITYFCYG